VAGLFSKPKSVKPPPVPPPPVIPEAGPETEDWAARAARRRAGFRKTIITGALEPMPTGGKTLLGG